MNEGLNLPTHAKSAMNPPLVTTPALTTVNQDFESVGRGAFELLRHRVDAAIPRPKPSWPEPELIVRETSGPPRPRS